MTADQQQQDWGLKAHRKAMFAVFLVSLASFQHGLDFGIIGGLQAMVPFLRIFGERDPSTPIGYNIASDRQQLISSLMVLGSFISSSTSGFTSAYIGRRWSLWVACVLVFVSVALMQTTTQIGGLYAGRLIIGLANGLLTTHAQLWIQESLPSKYRGLGVAMFSYWISIGSLVGTIVDNFAEKIDSRSAYIIPLGIVHVVPGILFFGIFLIPESPRWLAQQNQLERAEKALAWLRPSGWAIQEELVEIETALADEKLRKPKFTDMFANPVDRRRTTVAVLGLTTQAASGAMYAIAYGTYFFEMADVGNAFENTCLLNGVGVAAMLFNSVIITRYGYRRTMMLTGFLFCGLSQLIMAVVYTVEPGTRSTGRVTIGMSMILVIFYNACISSYAWLAGGELSTQRLRSHTMGIAAAVGFLGAWLVTFTAPYFINPSQLNWGPKYGYVWAGSCALTLVWVYFCLPEVKGRTLEEIDEMFEAQLPARKFSGYKCTGRPATLDNTPEEQGRVEEMHIIGSKDQKQPDVTVCDARGEL